MGYDDRYGTYIMHVFGLDINQHKREKNKCSYEFDFPIDDYKKDFFSFC